MLLAFFLPPLLILAIEVTFFGEFKGIDSGISFTRFANATLTAFTLCSLFLLGNLYFYGESRNRPLAPLVGMFMATGFGVLATVFFIGQGSNAAGRQWFGPSSSNLQHRSSVCFIWGDFPFTLRRSWSDLFSHYIPKTANSF